MTGTAVGTPITASDVDAGDAITFTITAGNASGAFAINDSTGQITVANGSLLDFDTPPTSYNLTIKAEEDSSGESDARSSYHQSDRCE